MNEQQVFVEALQESDPSRRREYLRQACGDDQALRQRVEMLLAAYEQAGSFMDRSAVELRDVLEPEPAEPLDDSQDVTSTKPPVGSEGPGSLIGHYKLLEQLGEGGMGTVYMAEQIKPVRRKVALKIIKPGMDTQRVIGRFQAERQALALMDHPHIAKVLDGGTTQSGRPFFVMELVKGVPITQYCDQHRLTLPERLALFTTVCQALQHAHQKGIIHRDIKPSNVMVATYDGRPVVKVIDFGVAKAIGQQLTEQTLFTAFGSIVGTLEYMSPEQAEFNALDVDTRSDVYSLGVLLYEMLTGTTPLRRERLRQAAITELLRVIREDEPPKPSTRLSETQDVLPSISAVRRMEPARLARLLRGELDWIVMKALEKDRNRRYETAVGLARDIERHLNNEAVEACPPSAGYKIRKFARRHKTALTTVAAFALLLVVAAITSSTLAIRAWRAEQLAHARLVQVRGALRDSEQSKKRAQAVADFLITTFRNPDPTYTGTNMTVAEMLDQAKAWLRDHVRDDPSIRSSLLDALGQTYTGLSPTDVAVQLLLEAHTLRVRAFGEKDPRTIRTLGHLAFATYLAGDVEEAICLGDKGVELARVAWATDDPESALPQLLVHLSVFYTVDARRDEQILKLCEEALKVTQSAPGDGHPDKPLAMWNLARALASVKRFEEALDLAQQAQAMFRARDGYDHPNTIRAALVEGHARYSNSQDWNEAICYFTELRDRSASRFGEDHHATHEITLAYLAYVHLTTKNYECVLELVIPALARYEASQGGDHFVAIRGQVVLASAYAHLGQFEKALEAGRRALVRVKAEFGPDHAKTKQIADELFRSEFAGITDDLGGERSLQLARPAMEMAESMFGPDHHVTLLAYLTLAYCYHETNLHAEAEPVMERAERLARRVRSTDAGFWPAAARWRVANQVNLGKYREVRVLLQDCQQNHLDDWWIYNTKSWIGEYLKGQQQYEDAESHLLEGYRGMKQRQREIPEPIRAARLRQAAQRLVDFYQTRGAEDDAKEAAYWQTEIQVGDPSTD